MALEEIAPISNAFVNAEKGKNTEIEIHLSKDSALDEETVKNAIKAAKAKFQSMKKSTEASL